MANMAKTTGRIVGNKERGTDQPSLERDGVDVEVFDQAQVVVHVLQAAQHLVGAAQQETGSTSLTGFEESEKRLRERADGVSVSRGTFSGD